MVFLLKSNVLKDTDLNVDKEELKMYGVRSKTPEKLLTHSKKIERKHRCAECEAQRGSSFEKNA